MNAGVLRHVSPTELSYPPFMGGKLMHNGSLVDIPVAGFPGGSPTLSANTHYYVVLETVSSVPTLGFYTASGKSHAPSGTTGNVGTEVLTIAGVTDDTKTLLGQVMTNGSGQFVSDAKHAWVRSWFNDNGIALECDVHNDGNSANYVRLPADNTYYEIVTANTNKDLRHYFLLWSDEVAWSHVNGQMHHETSNVNIMYGISLDGDTPIRGTRGQFYTDGAASAQIPHHGQRMYKGLAEGPHMATVKGVGEPSTFQGGAATIYFGGGHPYVTAHFLASQRFANAPAESAPEPPPGGSGALEYLGHDASGADGGGFSFTGKSFGTAALTRRIAVAIDGMTDSGTGSPSVSCTIGGVTATILKTHAPGNGAIAAIAIADVPTGTTGTIAPTFSVTMSRVGIHWWRLTDLASNTPVATAGATGNPAGLSMNVIANDIVLAAAYNNSTGSAPTFTGLTARGGDPLIETALYGAADHLATAAESPRTMTVGYSPDAGYNAAAAVVLR